MFHALSLISQRNHRLPWNGNSDYNRTYMVLIFFAISRLLLLLGSFVAEKTVPYLGFFPYKELLVDYNLPSWISSFANFDGIHYLLIAKQGYSQWEQAFFPLFPALLHVIGFIIPNYLVAALVLSNTALAIGLIFFQKLLKEWKINATLPILFLLAFPTAFFFGIVYTEGVFFMLFILSLYFLQKKNYLLAALFAAFSSATRLIGIFLLVPFFFHFLAEHKGSLKHFNLKAALISPFLGLFSYMFYLWITTKDPLFFFNSQPIFGAHRSTNLILLPQVYYRYIKILVTATHNFQWYMSLLEVSFFTLVFTVLALDLVQRGKQLVKRNKTSTSTTFPLLGLSLFSLINLVLPTLTGTFSSIPRYALFSLSFFIYLSQIQSKVIKWGVLILFITLQIVLLSLFVSGYFVG